MCYLVHEKQAGPCRATAEPLRAGRLRPRLAGVLAATLVGGLATAALVDPSWAPPLDTERDPTAPPPLVVGAQAPAPRSANSAFVPGRGQSPAQADDGVPTSPTNSATRWDGCQHGL